MRIIDLGGGRNGLCGLGLAILMAMVLALDVNAAHLVEVADLVQVEFIDGSTIHVTVVAAEPATDLAPLWLDRIPDGI